MPSLTNGGILSLLAQLNDTVPVLHLFTKDKPFDVVASLAEEVLRWRRLYLDQPEDRLYHAKDGTWWTRRDDTHLGMGALYSAPPPPEVSRAFAARVLLKKLVEVCEERNSRGEPAIGEDHTGAVNWLLDFADEAKSVVEGT